MTLKDFHKAFLTGTHHRCKKQPRHFPAHSGGKMLNYLLERVKLTTCAKDRKPWTGPARAGRAALCAMAVLALAAGCQTEPRHSTSTPPQSTNAPVPAASASPGATSNESTNSNKSMVLKEGDTIKIEFPGAPNLDTIQNIRIDGKITLQMIGEYDAVGKTPAAMEADLKRLYGSQLVNNEVSVTVQSAAFVVYVMGAVAKPGKLISERPLTPLEALIEAGVDDTKANLKAVQVIRTDGIGHTEKFNLNLHKVLHSKSAQMPSFTLKPYDVINVPERFNFY
jgi:polysaccharide biosynthesis/export protein